MIGQLAVEQRAPVPLNLALPMLRLPLAELLVHPIDVPPRPGRPEEGARRQGAQRARLLGRQLLGQHDALGGALEPHRAVYVLLQPVVDKGAVSAGDHDGVAHAVPVAALVAQHRVVRAGRVEEARKRPEGEGVGVEKYAAVVEQDLQAHQVFYAVHGLAVRVLDFVFHEAHVGAETSDPRVCDGVQLGVDRVAGRRENGVVELDFVGAEGYLGAAHREVVYKVELNAAGLGERFFEYVQEVHDVGDIVRVGGV